MTIMNQGMGKLYSATEEANGIINPALQLDSTDEEETAVDKDLPCLPIQRNTSKT